VAPVAQKRPNGNLNLEHDLQKKENQRPGVRGDHAIRVVGKRVKEEGLGKTGESACGREKTAKKQTKARGHYFVTKKQQTR